jgi:hypothetical protein
MLQCNIFYQKRAQNVIRTAAKKDRGFGKAMRRAGQGVRVLVAVVD